MGIADRVKKIISESELGNTGAQIVDFFKSLGTYNMFDTLAGAMPNKIVVRHDAKIPVPQQKTPTSDALKLQGQKEVNALVKQTTFTLNERKQLLTELQKLRANDITETIIDVFIDDGLVSKGNKIFETLEYTGEVDNDLINASVSKLFKKHNPDKIVLDFADEALLFGEYMLPLEYTQGYGITNIGDNADLENIVCVYEGSDKQYFLRKNGQNLEQLDKDSHIHFVTTPKKLRVKVKDMTSFQVDNNYTLPKYIRVGKSIIFPVMNKIKQLQTLEMANLASDLREILKPTIVSIGMPEKTPPDRIQEIVERYEMIFSNIFSGMDNLDNLNFSDLLTAVTTIKVLPAPSDGRGGFVKPDLINVQNNSEKAQEIRRAIAQTVGLPYYYLSVKDTPQNKLESLKLFSRYARKLNSMQECIIEGIKELICIHVFYHLGKKIHPEDIKISMREIVNIELLDRMEYLVALMTGLEEILKLVSYVEENKYINIGVDNEVLLTILNKNLAEFQGYSNLFIYKDKSKNASQTITDLQNISTENITTFEKHFKKVGNV